MSGSNLPDAKGNKMADELLDVVNNNDEVTGRTLRSDVHAQGLLHRGVHVFLFNERGEMLIQQRSADRVHSPSLLDCSVSEHVKAGESYLEAAIRGLREEMGVEGIDLKRAGKIKMEYGPNDHEISCIFEGRVNPANVTFDPEEIAGIQYLKLDEIQNRMVSEKTMFCRWFVEIMRWYSGESADLEILG